VSEDLVVGVDARGVSVEVLLWLKGRAASSGDLRIEIVTVAELGRVPPDAADIEYRNAYEQAMGDAKKRVSADLPGVPVTATMMWGIAADQLVEASSRADVLVLGSEKTGVIQGWVSGTVPLRVAARSACTVVVVPRAWRATPRRLVVAGASLDGSDDSALAFAAAEAARTGADLLLVHALRIPQALLAEDLLSPSVQDEIREKATRRLRLVVGELESQYPGVSIGTSITTERASLALATESRDAVVVVVGTHGRGAVSRVVLGSVGHDLLLDTSCPVAVVPAGVAKR
jgi:nucleotide-binding universal stress UspA family protein